MDVKPGFKQTELGVIPEDWRVTSLGSLVEPSAPIRYGVVQIGADTANGMPIVPIKHIKEIDTAKLPKSSLEIEARYSGSRISGGDVLISVKGTIGRVGIVPPNFNGNIAREIARLRIKAGECPEFTMHQLEADHTQRRISEAVVGTTRLEFSIAAVRKFEMPMPPTYAEQVRISNAISDVDELVLALSRLIAKKRDLRTASRQQLLTGKGRLLGFTDDWIECAVGDCIQRYFCGPSPTCEERNIYGEEEWGVLKTTAITWEQGWDWKKHKVLPVAHWGKTNIEILAGDVIVTKAGPRHRVGVSASVDFVPPRIVVSGKMIALRPDPAIALGPMLASAIAAKEAQTFLDQRTTGMAESQVNFENDVLLDTPIVLPKIEEQRAIIDVLSDMDAEITALEARLEKTRALKQGMMQALLTGRVRLPVKGETLDALEVAHA